MILNSYQRDIVNSNHKRNILIGARQIGKTTTIIEDAVETEAQPIIFAVSHRHADLIRNQVRERGAQTSDQFDVTDEVSVASAYKLDDRINVNEEVSLYVDEASELDDGKLFEIIEWDRSPVSRIVITQTPRPTPNVIDYYAKYSSRWFSVHVPSEENPMIDDASWQKQLNGYELGSLDHI